MELSQQLVRTQFTIYYVPRIFFSDLTGGALTLVTYPLATPLLLCFTLV